MKGVLVVPPGSLWVGPTLSYKTLLAEMREVRSLTSISVLNTSGTPLKLDVEEVPAAKQMSLTDVNIAGLFKGEEQIVIVHAATPLITAAIIEKCAEDLKRGASIAVTCHCVTVATGTVAGTDPLAYYRSFTTGWVPVFGVRAFRASKAEQSGLSFIPIEINKKQGLSLLNETDRELIESLEHAGRI